MKTNIDTKELEIVKSNTNKAVAAANELVVESQDDMLHATELLSKINKAGDMIKAQKEAITKPLNASLAAARELFKPLELIKAEAKSIVSRKMIDFQTKFEAERAAQEAKIVARVEKGTLKIETAVRKVEALEKVENKVEAVSGSVTFKEVRVTKVIDENLLPREYLEVNMVKVRKDALAGVQIPGVVVEIEKQLSNSR
jgi:hypothetical protein